jgi:3-deoxy-manno-octulosonate cytidylyltransferase (CMP-KDO synthetase)
MNTPKILGVIPARYASSRFPGKPLIDIAGKSMIRRVYEQASKALLLDDVVVATDDERILNHVKSFGGKVEFTSPNHRTGTDRCAEIASMNQYAEYQFIINIQGDEPLIDPAQIDLLAELFHLRNPELATLIRPLGNPDDYANPNIIKVVTANNGEALYFSRAPIPYVRNVELLEYLKENTFNQHIGIYGYRRQTLMEISALNQSLNELTESLEQLRWLDHGYRILTAVSSHKSYSIDVPDDVMKVIDMIDCI